MNSIVKSLAALATVSLLGFGCLPSLSFNKNEDINDSNASGGDNANGELVSVPANFSPAISFPTDAFFYYAEVSDDQTIGGAMFSTAITIQAAIEFYTSTLSMQGFTLADTLDSTTGIEAYYTNTETSTVVFVTATEGTDGYSTVEVLYGPDDY